ncbi:hypothetical protein ACN38_g8852 [Penicillium nordicum]|uniref:Uncharacterized protein n=1 Tax=Penicillium nordicum TaxID=229535 RepID=A0A0M9WD29_9EURO|nr:hypothetical protein ACN38_g8852 [Penicillium nordicum]
MKLTAPVRNWNQFSTTPVSLSTVSRPTISFCCRLRRGRAAKGQMPESSGLRHMCLNMPEFCLILDWQKSKYLNYSYRELNKQSISQPWKSVNTPFRYRLLN